MVAVVVVSVSLAVCSNEFEAGACHVFVCSLASEPSVEVGLTVPVDGSFQDTNRQPQNY